MGINMIDELKEVAIIKVGVQKDGTLKAYEVWHDPDYDVEVIIDAVKKEAGGRE